VRRVRSQSAPRLGLAGVARDFQANFETGRGMSRKKVSTTIYITPEQAERLKLLHDRTKVPIAVYIREGIDLMLKHYEHVLPGQMTLEGPPKK
jgi:hypothetical protein